MLHDEVGDQFLPKNHRLSFDKPDKLAPAVVREAALGLDPWFVPVDAAIVGVVDEVYTPERTS